MTGAHDSNFRNPGRDIGKGGQRILREGGDVTARRDRRTRMARHDLQEMGRKSAFSLDSLY